MPIERLAWDSSFFGIEVGRTCRRSLADAGCEADKYDLLYLVEDRPIEDFSGLLPARTCFPADCRVVYSKLISCVEFPVDPRVKVYRDFPVEAAQLYPLAYICGQHSRYKSDPAFPSGTFEAMYRVWIDNSLSGAMADYLFYIEDNGVVLSFATLKITPDKGVIGLIASREECRGLGLGRAMVVRCEEVLRRAGIRRLEVATQRDNREACLFYEKHDMKVIDRKYIYHSWKQNAINKSL